METIIQNLPILIPTVLAAAVFAFLASRNRFALWFTAMEGLIALFDFCYMMYMGAEPSELLLVMLVLLLPSMLFKSVKGGDEK